MDARQREIAATALGTGAGALLVSGDPLMAAIYAGGTVVTMDAAYSAAVEEIAKIEAEEASRNVRAIPVSER